jgi:hypothetical protein
MSTNQPPETQPLEQQANLLSPNGGDGEGEGESEEEGDRDREGVMEVGGADRGQSGGVIQKGAGGGDVTWDVIRSEDKSTVILERGGWGDVISKSQIENPVKGGGGGAGNEILDKKKREMKVASAHRDPNVLRILRSNPEKRSVEDVEVIVEVIGMSLGLNPKP